jgi:alpha/beta superfamily hydrolase
VADDVSRRRERKERRHDGVVQTTWKNLLDGGIGELDDVERGLPARRRALDKRQVFRIEGYSMPGLHPRKFACFLGAAAVATWALPCALVASASAAPIATTHPCPDVEVVFARGTGEPPGVGPTGQAFVDSLRARIGAKSFRVYPVNYPASDDWPTGVNGIKDASAHVVSMAASCPKTRMVLGGWSQGAAVMGFVTSAAVPDGVDPATVPKPLQPEVADHVAAVVLLGEPNVRAMNFLGEPPIVIGPLYAGKTIQLCVPNDGVCSDGLDFAVHDPDLYAQDGMVDQGAAFAESHL